MSSISDFKITKCFTFYSYKGGSGRSTTLINTAKHLIDELKVSPNNPMLIVDADLESAGLTYFFNMENKFTCKFQQSINTATLIFQNGSYFCDNTADYAFGTADPMLRYGLSPSLIEKLETAAKNAYNIKQLFDSVHINSNEKMMLTTMVESYLKVMNQPDIPENSTDFEIFTSYNISDLFFDLNEIENNSNLSFAQKISEKESTISNFLPAQQFTDISEYFDAPIGSVKFLGADIKSKDIIPHGGDLPSYIKKLILQCSLRNYCAVLFDSGAGTQSTPYALHKASDVLVYCLRPSKQFAKGTMMQIFNSKNDVVAVAKELGKFGTDKKMIIILPTAISEIDDTSKALCESSFISINNIANSFPNIIDASFCSPEKGLNEVKIFKWREIILGSKNLKQCDPSEKELLKIYSDENTMPSDAKKAYGVYRALAKKLIFNS